MMKVNCVWEHNGNDSLLYAADYPGAFTRGASLEEALGKMPDEIAAYLRWRGQTPPERVIPQVAQEKESTLCVADADSDVLFDTERPPLTMEEYQSLRDLALRSAKDFLALYQSLADKTQPLFPARETFYGPIPHTAQEIYDHVKNVNRYYFGEIHVEADCLGDIWECRRRGFALLERQPDFLQNTLYRGSYDEDWTLRKVCRRCIWHDRIHARASLRRLPFTSLDASAE